MPSLLTDTLTYELSVEPLGRSGPENMALDQALLEEADRTGRAFLRLYRFDPPCLSFGRNEPARERYDAATIARLGLDTVRRPTGGRAVWHDQEVTYAVAAPVSAFGSLRDAYREIHERLTAALQSLGADATLAPDRPSARPPDRRSPCFATAAGGEVLIRGRKVIGSAQLQLGAAFLQHGSILLDGSQGMLSAVSRKPQAASGATTLSGSLGRPVTFAEVAEAVVRVWEDDVTLTIPYRPLPSPTAPPSTARFSDPAWTWRR